MDMYMMIGGVALIAVGVLVLVLVPAARARVLAVLSMVGGVVLVALSTLRSVRRAHDRAQQIGDGLAKKDAKIQQVESVAVVAAKVERELDSSTPTTDKANQIVEEAKKWK